MTAYIYRQPVYVGIYLPLAPAHSNYRLGRKKKLPFNTGGCKIEVTAWARLIV
jgi:hypothetical protein